MDKYLVIVESPTKAKTIRKFLPNNYIVEASMGHVRDLPQSAADIPEKLKKEEWTKLGVNVKKDFEPLYITPKGKSKVISLLRSKMKDVKAIYLATDEDREGESISWHLIEILKPKVPVKRMVFHEITKTAIKNALEETREVDQNLVKAQETRRILDRLYGYTLSPLLWKKIAYGLSAGRVQSIGLRLAVERERERIMFKKADYWDIKAMVYPTAKTAKVAFETKLIALKNKKIATGKDFEDLTGKLAKNKEKELTILDEKAAKNLTAELKKSDWVVDSMEEKESVARPAQPFTTSTLQQEGNRKLHLSAKDTMRIAQRLYEEGLITYMRTDSPNLSQEAINGARKSIVDLYGKEYLSPEPRQYKSKAASAQEAHEAIRPAGSDFVHPDDTGLSGKEKALYELIWKRTMATQMAEAKKLTLSVRIVAGDAEFASSGTRIVFPGFLRVYVEGSDDPEAALDEKEVILPDFKVGDKLKTDSIEPLFHETKPPARFTEASLVQRLEKDGIGRPSTYASIIGTIQDRGYVRKDGTALVPTYTGMAVVQLLEKHFTELIDYNFTSQMEYSLDEIAIGVKDWLVYLKEFYSGKDGLEKKVIEREKKIKPEESRTILLPQITEMEVKVGRFGPYIIAAKGKKKTEEVHASIPEDIAPADLKQEHINQLIEISQKGPTPIGKHPETGENIYCLVGRYGPYLQLGEVTEENPKPKRASLPKNYDPKNVDIQSAAQLLILPRILGKHPDTKKEIKANNGRFGPYVVHDGEFRSLKKTDDVYTITLKRAVELLAEEKKSKRGSTLIKDFDKHPKTKKKLAVYQGKYGFYIKHGTKNITIPEESRDLAKIEKMKVEDIVKIISSANK
ncbi:MAG: type I DNA topoisomerase [Bacteriovoracaceae bacterium]|nr:type I DNA topoisomerase [Bacteriovoracaceae bacterium]